MSLTDGLEYLNTTKNRIKTQLQDKGVDVSDDTPFKDFPPKISRELKNKSWQYPSDWFPLTPKAEFPDSTIEMVAFDVEYPFSFYVSGENCTITVYGNDVGGTYILDNESKNLNQTYSIPNGNIVLQFIKGTGLPSNSVDFTTLKIVITSDGLTTFYPCPIEMKYLTYSPILAFRAKDTLPSEKELYFGKSYTSADETPVSRCILRYMQYCDLAMVDELTAKEYLFKDCWQLVKCELPKGFVLPSYAFYKNLHLEEVIGADFINSYTDKSYVFTDCNKFKPPSFNYVGSHNYTNCNLNGMTINLPPIEHYPEFFATITGADEHKQIDGGQIPKAKIIVPDTVESMDYCAFSDLSSEVIVHLPSASVEIATEPNPEEAHKIDYFICKPFSIENGEEFYTSTPLSIKINAQYGAKEIYLPNVPLRILTAGNSQSCGNLESITFDWSATDFSTIPENFSGYVIDISGNNFNHDSLVELFNYLPVVDVPRNIKITNNPGVSSLTDEEIALVIDKGYILMK